jgi:hypothetical protein
MLPAVFCAAGEGSATSRYSFPAMGFKQERELQDWRKEKGPY